MTRGPLTFKESDLKRAVKSAKESGLEVTSIEITKAGNIVVHVAGEEVEPIDKKEEDDTWEDVV